MKREDSDLVCRVEPGTVMHRYAKLYWLPAIRSEMLKPGGKPERVRLLGENYVAFRAEDGRVGFFDENCPHRRVSLTLARNQNCTLTCIYHGWQFGVDGEVKATPSEPVDTREAFRKKVRLRHFKTHEAGGAVWVYLGNQEAVPPFPDYEFNTVPSERVYTLRALMHCNWLQALESTLDSAHVGVLHAAFLTQVSGNAGLDEVRLTLNAAPVFEMESTDYGFREAALRKLADGSTYARIREVSLPFLSFIPTATGAPKVTIASIPIDDQHCAQWYWYYSDSGPIEGQVHPNSIAGEMGGTFDNFCEGLGNAENTWNQQRDKMHSHWSGLPGPLPWEDFIVTESMGPTVDREREHLGTSDVIIARTRRMLVQMLRNFEKGTVPEVAVKGFDAGKLTGLSVRYLGQLDWRTLDARKLPSDLLPMS